MTNTKKSAGEKANAAAKPNKPKTDTRKAFLWMLIASLSISALIAIIIFLGGDTGGTQGRVLMTTLAVGFYSLLGLCCTSLYDRGRYIPVVALGLLAAIAGFVYSVVLIWSDTIVGTNWRVLFTLLVISVAFAHASLLLLIDLTKNLAQLARALTLGFITVVAGLLIFKIFGGDDGGTDVLWRAIGVFAVLDALGTIVTPLLRKIET